MLNDSEVVGLASGAQEGARRATGSAPDAVAEVKRWSAGRKKRVVLRMLRGESADALSREVAVPIYRLEEWRDRALAGMDTGLKERVNDTVEKLLDDANRRIGELVMENEILRKERQVKRKPSDKGVADDAIAAQDPAILKRVGGLSHAEKIFR